MNNIEIADRLDMTCLGRFGFNKCTTGERVTLTVFPVDSVGEDTYEELTLTPLELIGFCRAVLDKCDTCEGCERGMERNKASLRECAMCKRFPYRDNYNKAKGADTCQR